MPTYEYQCDKCRRIFEVRQRISEPALKTHEACGGDVRRLLSAAPFILKGGGWYVTDYPSEARKKGSESDGKADTKKADDKKDTKAPTTSTPAPASTASAPTSTPTSSTAD